MFWDIVKEKLAFAGNFIKEKAIMIGKAIASVGTVNLIKAGLFAGAACVSAYVLIKGIKSRFESTKDESEMDPVDKNIGLNFRDRRKQRNLHKRMKNVKRALNHDEREKMFREKYGTIVDMIWTDRKQNDPKYREYWNGFEKCVFPTRFYDPWNEENLEYDHNLQRFYEYFYNFDPDSSNGSEGMKDENALRRTWLNTNWCYNTCE